MSAFIFMASQINETALRQSEIAQILAGSINFAMIKMFFDRDCFRKIQKNVEIQM